MDEDLSVYSDDDDLRITENTGDLRVTVHEDDVRVLLDASISVNGQGIIPGGLTGQVLTKRSEIDYEMVWSDPGVGVPSGGDTGQILAKLGPEPYNTAWQTPITVPAGGITGYVLTKSTDVDYDMVWVPPLDSTLFIVKSGDAMQGMLTLFDDPTSELDAVPKRYVDLKSNIDSPAFTGTPTAPSPAGEDNSDRIATTSFVQSLASGFVPLDGGIMTGFLTLNAAPTSALHAVTKLYADTKAPIASPAFTGIPTAPTAAPGTSTTQLATTEFVISGLGSYLPLSGGAMAGDLDMGSNTLFNLPTPLQPDHAATKAYVDVKAPINSPIFTGTPEAPTAVAGTSSNQIATTSFVQAATSGVFLPLAGGTLTGFLTLNADPTALLHAVTKQYADTRFDLKANIAGSTFTGAVTIINSFLQISRIGQAAAADLYLSVDAGQLAYFNFRTGTSRRWRLGKTSSAEAGANAGSDFALQSFDDSDLLIGNVFTINRASRIVNFNISPTAPTPTAGDSSTKVATTAFVAASVSGGGSFLPTSGGTLTGPLILAADPTDPLGAATKQMVDAYLDSPAFTGTPTAPTAVAGTNTTQIATTAFVRTELGSYLPIAGGSLTGFLSLHANPTDALHAVTKQYVDAADALKANLSGATFTGNIVLSNNAYLQIAATTSSALYMQSNAGVTSYIRWRTGSSNRWYLGKNSVAETGSNAGSGFTLTALDDAGVSLGTAFIVDRASQVMNFTVSPTAPTPTAGDNSTKLATTAFVTAATGGGYLPLTGGTLTNFLTLHADPIDVLHAATKQYVDAADALKANLSGATFTGNLAVSNNFYITRTGEAIAANMYISVDNSETAYINWRTGALLRWRFGKSGTAESGSNVGSDFAFQSYDDAGVSLGNVFTVSRASRILNFNLAPTSVTPTAGDNSTKLATTAFVATALGSYLPLAGGTLTNFLSLHADPTSALHATTKQYVDTAAALKANLSGATFTGGVVVDGIFQVSRIGDATTATAYINADDGFGSQISFRTGTSSRWVLGKSAGSETGSDAGSDFFLDRYTDAGVVGTILNINRASRIVDFSVSPTVPTPTAGDSSQKVASTAFVAALGALKADLTGATFTGNIVTTGGFLQVARTGANSDLYLDTDPGRGANFRLRVSAQSRWVFGKNSTAESTGNVGSDFFMNRYDNTGVLLGAVLTIARSSGIVAFTVSPTTPTPTAGDSTTKVATTAFVANAIAGATTGGVPSGGLTDQVLTKKSDSNYDMEWRNAAGTGTYLALSGGTMTGKLTLASASQTGSNDAATIGYVDTAVASKADLASPALTGNPTAPTPATSDNDTSVATTAYVKSNLASYLPLAGGILTGFLTLHADPTSALHAVTKQYVDAADALKANLAGAVFTGDVEVNRVGAGAQAELSLNSDTTVGSILRLKSNSQSRWVIGTINAETGGNAGSDFFFNRYDDAGAVIDRPITILRSSGIAAFLYSPTAPTPSTGDNTTKVATTAYVKSNLGSYLPLAGGILTGFLTLHADPTAALHAVTKQYVDSADALKANLTGATFTGNILTNGGYIQISRTGDATSADLYMDADAGNSTYLRFRTGAFIRWHIGKNANAESGSNAGSDFGLSAYNDAGALLGTVFTVTRATRVTAFSVSPTAPTPGAGDNSTKVATTAFVTAAVSGAGSFLPISGGTMTGHITLPSSTPSSLQAAHRQYVDAADALKADLNSPTFTGAPTAPTAPAYTNTTQIATTAFVTGSFVRLTGGTLTGFLTLHAAPSNDMHAATKKYVDDLGALKANLAGATFTGNVITKGYFQVHRIGDAATANLYIDSDVGFVSQISLRSGGLNRWVFGKNATAESGANAGSDFFLNRYLDDGTTVGNIFTISRASRVLDFAVSPTAPTPAGGDSSQKLATTEFVTTAVTGSGSFLPITGGTLTGPLILDGDPTNDLGAATKQMVTLKSNINSPAFTGTPTAPTPATSDNDISIATTAYVKANLALYLPLAGGTLGGALNMGGNVIGGVGTPTASTHAATKSYVDDGLATKAPLTSPAFTGTPTAPTASLATNNTQIATTAFVHNAVSGGVGGFLPVSGGTMTGDLILNADPTVALGAATKQMVDLKSNLASPAFTGNPTAPTQAVGNNSTRLATTAFVQTELAGYLLRAGGTMTGVLSMGGFIITDLPTPTLSDHVATKGYADTKAPLASPIFTGDPARNTDVSLSDNSNKFATTKFVLAKLGTGAYLPTAGGTMAGDINMAGNNIINTPAPTVNTGLMRARDIIEQRELGNYNFSEWDVADTAPIGFTAGVVRTGGEYGALRLQVASGVTIVETVLHPVDTDSYYECSALISCTSTSVPVRLGVRCYGADGVTSLGDVWPIGGASGTSGYPTTNVSVGGVVRGEKSGTGLRWNFPLNTKYYKRICVNSAASGTAYLDCFIFRKLGKGEDITGEMFGMVANGPATPLDTYGAWNKKAFIELVGYLETEGGVAILGAGTYDMNTGFNFDGDNTNKPFTIKGHGKDATILRRSAYVSGAQQYQFNYFDNITLKDFTIDTNNDAFPGSYGTRPETPKPAWPPTITSPAAGQHCDGTGYDAGHILAIRHGSYNTVDGIKINYGGRGTMLYICGSQSTPLEGIVVKNCFLDGQDASANGYLLIWCNDPLMENVVAHRVRSVRFLPYTYDPDGEGAFYYETHTPAMGIQYKYETQRGVMDNIRASLCRVGVAFTGGTYDGVPRQQTDCRVTGASILIGKGAAFGMDTDRCVSGQFTGIIIEGGNYYQPDTGLGQVVALGIGEENRNCNYEVVLRNVADYDVAGRAVYPVKFYGSGNPTRDNYVQISTISDCGTTNTINFGSNTQMNTVLIGTLNGRTTIPAGYVLDSGTDNVVKLMRTLT